MSRFYLKLSMAIAILFSVVNAGENGVFLGLGAGVMHSSYKANNGESPLFSGAKNFSLDTKIGYQYYVLQPLAIRGYARWLGAVGVINNSDDSLKNVSFNIDSFKKKVTGTTYETQTRSFSGSATGGSPNFYSEVSANVDLVFTINAGVDIDLIAGLGLASTVDVLGVIKSVLLFESPTFFNVPFHLGAAFGSSSDKVEFLLSMPFVSNSVNLSKAISNLDSSSPIYKFINQNDFTAKHINFTISWVHVF